MLQISDPLAFRKICQQLREAGELALVPTMGALHDGHWALCHEGKRSAAHLAVSIFVNPTQFGPGEDFERYPRDLAADLEGCRVNGVDVVFTPNVEQMYPDGEVTRISVRRLSEGLCGATRPGGHFDGVATIVAKLFNLCGPCTAIFGQKDYQQLKIIERMVKDLLLPVEVIGHPIVREADGLAMSSRNRYLEPVERRQALGLVRGLAAANREYMAGERDAAVLQEHCRRKLLEHRVRVEYVSVVDAQTLEPQLAVNGECVLAVAGFVATTRLIDNVVLGQPLPPQIGAEQ